MRIILVLSLVVLVFDVFADDHDTTKTKQLPMALWSTYEIPAGGSPAAIEASLTDYLEGEERAGFLNCLMYKHQFGSQRGFYTSCLFSDLEHFAKIVDGRVESEPEDDTQLFGRHTDHLVVMTSRAMNKTPNHILFSTTNFSPTMTYEEMAKSADVFYGAYQEAFVACNRYEHGWGPEMAFYITCGFDDYAAFSKAAAKLMPIFKERLHDAKLGIRTHSDDLLIKVME